VRGDRSKGAISAQEGHAKEDPAKENWKGEKVIRADSSRQKEGDKRDQGQDVEALRRVVRKMRHFLSLKKTKRRSSQYARKNRRQK